MTIRIVASGALNQDTFESAGRFVKDGRQLLLIDLRNQFFVDSYALVTLLTIASLWAKDGLDVRLRLPTSKSSRTYMARMRFFELLPDAVQVDGERPSVQEHVSWLVPLSPLDFASGEHSIEQLANFVWDQLPLRLRTHFVEAVAEIGANAIQHSGAAVGFVAGQRFEKAYQGRRGPRLQLIVADAGIGIRQSLAEALPEFEDISDGQAILRALQPGVTSKPGVHSGVGLTTVWEYVRMFEGVLRIRSATATVVVRGTRNPQVRTVAGLPGTIVSVELSSGRVRRR